MEDDAARAQIVEDRDQIAQAAPQAVKFPDDEGIAVLEGLEATHQARTLDRRA